MALPSSGSISIGQIRAELGTSSGSLRQLSSMAGKGTPDSMSEFRGYSHLNLEVQHWYGPTNFNDACRLNDRLEHRDVYLDTMAMRVWKDSNGTGQIPDGYYHNGKMTISAMKGGYMYMLCEEGGPPKRPR